MTEAITPDSRVRDLRHRWKPHKERLAALGGEQAASIRFHRACSWLARGEQMQRLLRASTRCSAGPAEGVGWTGEGRSGMTN
jgi:hypothetical protein